MAKMATVLVFQMVVKMLHIGRKKKKCLQCLSQKKLFQNNKDWDFFYRTYEADAKRVVVSGKDYLRRLQLKHAYLKKNTLLCGFKGTQHTFFRL